MIPLPGFPGASLWGALVLKKKLCPLIHGFKSRGHSVKLSLSRCFVHRDGDRPEGYVTARNGGFQEGIREGMSHSP
jgi:hypothetical protein